MGRQYKPTYQQKVYTIQGNTYNWNHNILQSKHYKRVIRVSQNQKSASINGLKYLQTKVKKNKR